MALHPVFSPEHAAKILWRLILTDRAKLEDFDTPPPGFNGDVSKFRNLAREYAHLEKDPDVLNDVATYLSHFDPQPEATERVQVVSPRDFVPSSDPLPVEPNQELDGITTFTNHPSPEDLPF
jgi:hypothetical protein